jgi:hypothetical protein
VVKIYRDTMPVTADTAVGSQVLLVTLTFSATAFSPSSEGTVDAYAISDGIAIETGTASWARICNRDGTTIMDVDVGTSAATLIIEDTAIVEDMVVSISSGQFTMPPGV